MLVSGFAPLEKISKKRVVFLKKNKIDFIIYKEKKKSCNMRFKSDVGSSPPPFKRVVMLTRHWAAEGKMK